jgi:hypothetical protein
MPIGSSYWFLLTTDTSTGDIAGYYSITSAAPGVVIQDGPFLSVGSSATSQTTVATPVFSVATGTYSSPQTVAIACATAGATIYFTIDGSNPTSASPVYSTPLTVSATTTVKAIAVKSGMTTSMVAANTITIQLILSPVTFGNFTAGSQAGNVVSFTGIGNAVSDQAISAVEPFSVVANLDSNSNGIAIVVSASATAENWGSGVDVFPFGFLVSSGILHHTAKNGILSTNLGAVSLPCMIRGRRSGQDAIIEISTDSGATWVQRHQVVSAFSNQAYSASGTLPTNSVYVKTISGLGAGSVTVQRGN